MTWTYRDAVTVVKVPVELHTSFQFDTSNIPLYYYWCCIGGGGLIIRPAPLTWLSRHWCIPITCFVLFRTAVHIIWCGMMRHETALVRERRRVNKCTGSRLVLNVLIVFLEPAVIRSEEYQGRTLRRRPRRYSY